MLFYQIGVGRPHVHTDDAQRMATPCAHFSGEKRFHYFLGPVVADPQQNPPLQIVNHRQIDLTLPSAHLIDANDMYRRTDSMSQTIGHRSFHDGRYTLPVQIRTGEPSPANSTPVPVSPPHSTTSWSLAPTGPPRESPPPADRTGGIRLAGGGSAVSTVLCASTDRAIPAACAHCAPSDSAAGFASAHSK